MVFVCCLVLLLKATHGFTKKKKKAKGVFSLCVVRRFVCGNLHPVIAFTFSKWRLAHSPLFFFCCGLVSYSYVPYLLYR